MKINKKLLILLAALLLMPAAGFSQDGKKMGWQLELNRASLNITSTEVKNADKYQGFPNSRLTADSQSLIQGYLNTTANYFASGYLWSNGILMEYGRTKVRPVQGQSITTENADRILVTSDYMLRLWQVNDFLGGFEAGPFISAGYETEFSAKSNTNRKEIFRGMGGLKLFEGKYIKSFYVAAVGEADFTFNPESTKLAWETGLKLEQPIREGVKATYSAMFRNYLSESRRQPTDLRYELELDARMDVLVYKNLSVAPFINYFLARAKDFSAKGESFQAGVSFSFSTIFKKAKEI